MLGKIEKFFSRHILLYTYVFLSLILSIFAGISFLSSVELGWVEEPLPTFIGLFVPTLIFNSIYSFGIAPVVVIVTLLFLDRRFQGTALSVSLKFLYSLFILFCLTIIIDVILWGDPASLGLFLESIDIQPNLEIWDGLVDIEM